jgi:PAS domain S-box-containing protein
VTAAEAGVGKAFQPLLKNLKQGNLPNCMQRVLAKPGILAIKDPASTCSDCPLANIHKERGVFSSRLEHDGKIYGILTISFPLDYFSGKEERSLFKEIVGDIAYALRHIEMEEERKRAEESLRKSEEKYRTLTDNVNVGVYRNILGPKGKFIEINPAIVKMFGYKSKKELLSINVADLYQNPEGRRKFNAKILQDGFVKNEELQLKKKDGTPIIGSVSAVVIKDNKGKVKYYDGVIEDVTERKRAEEALRIERDNLTRILESMEDGVYIVNQQYDIEYVNSLLMKEFGHPRKKKCYEYFHDRKEVCPWCQNKDVFAGKTVRWEWHSFKKQKTYDLIDTPIKKPDGSISKLEIFRDITERKKAEEQIKASLKEKEVLLQEVHHRVKNNMQLISSLFSLQSRHIKDKQAFEIFKSSQNRVRSMAIIHERFYQSKDFARVDFAEYVQSLTGHLLSSYRIKPDVIKLYINIKDAFLDLNTAIPCGLIINELLSNSLKHAFPDDKKGEINIAMRSLKGNEIELIVTDNGVGLPKGIDFIGTKTLGLHLVRILAKDQLHGDIKLDRAKGTSFSIRFRRKP